MAHGGRPAGTATESRRTRSSLARVWMDSGCSGQPPCPMDNETVRARTYFLLLLFLALRGFGNLSLTWGTRQVSSKLTLAFNPLDYLAAMLDPFIAAGIAMLILALFTRLALLSVADLTFVLPMTAVGYVFAAVLGRVFLHEQVTPVRWLAIFLIFAGAALVGSTSQSTTKPEGRTG